MGHVHVDARVSARRSATIRFLVDTGATFAVVPPSLVRRLGAVLLPGTFTIEMADGQRKKVRACTLRIDLGRRSGPATALVLPGSKPLLGVETLEGLGLRVDPGKGRLEPTRRATVLAVGTRMPR